MGLRPRMAAFRGSSHATSATYADWPYRVHDGPRRSKEECDAVLDSIAEDTGESRRRRTLYSSRSFKKFASSTFTDDHKRCEQEHP